MQNNCHLTRVSGIEFLTSDEANILLNFQSIWIDFVHWIRSYYHTVFGNLPEQRSIGARLFLELPKDLYNEFRKYFNQEEANEFLDIYSRFTAGNWQLADSYKSKDKTSIDLSTAQYYRNADELASFLAKVNKYYDGTQLKALLYDFISEKINEINALLNGNYDLEMKIFDELKEKAEAIGIYMALGVIAMRRDQNSK